METLRTAVTVALFTISRPIKNGFAGSGVSRKREPFAADMLAERIALQVCRNHRFSLNDETVEPQKIVHAMLKETLTALTDDLVKAYASKSQLVAHPAAEEICRVLVHALTTKWMVTYVDPEIKFHSAPR